MPYISQLADQERKRQVGVSGRDVKIVFFQIFDSRKQKFDFFFDYRLSAVARNWFRLVSSMDDESGCALSMHWQPDVLLVVPSAPWLRDPLQLRLQQHWCIPPTATVWHIQALARRTVARGYCGSTTVATTYRRSSVTARQSRRQKASRRRRHATWWSNW